MHIRRAETSDSLPMAALHMRQIHWGLLSQLGEEFVTAFYRTLIHSPVGFGFVAEQEGRIAGFASGVVHWRRFYLEFLRRHLGLVTRTLVAAAGAARWRRLWQTTRYAASGVLPQAELVSIALEPTARGAGVADALVRAVLSEFASRGVEAVRVTAGGTNDAARRLYERVGFTLHAQAEIHPGEAAAVYVMPLPRGRLPAVDHVAGGTDGQE
ncbi:MAG: GNAT family N-acetyltransferase [Armatimonadota bacterium]|nr:GNAT family N-acetyltransferase [Armatimonadota bacterium]MDR7549007.1 GNAT family N-acetyltransferase [Armatimonadota bacterium]